MKMVPASRFSTRGVRSLARPAIHPLAVLLLIVAGPAQLAPAADPPPPAPVAAESQNAESQGPPNLSGPAWAMHALGPFYGGVFFGLAVTLVALLVLNFRAIRSERVIPLPLIERFELLVSRRRYREAFEAARDDPSMLGRVLQSAMARLSYGYDRAVEAMQEAADEENMKLEQGLGYLALVGTIAPMVGLLGTVHGMIASFSVIAVMTSTPPPWQLAGGISTALFTTLVGLAIAIPAIAAYNIFRNRAARLALEVNLISEDLMLRIAHRTKSNETKGDGP